MFVDLVTSLSTGDTAGLRRKEETAWPSRFSAFNLLMNCGSSRSTFIIFNELVCGIV